MSVIASEIYKTAEFWGVLFPGIEAPCAQQWALWFLKHDEVTIRKGLVRLASKYKTLGGQMDAEYMAKFLSTVLNRLSAQQVVGSSSK